MQKCRYDGQFPNIKLIFRKIENYKNIFDLNELMTKISKLDPMIIEREPGQYNMQLTFIH